MSSPIEAAAVVPSYKDLCTRTRTAKDGLKSRSPDKAWKPVKVKEHRPTRQAAGATTIARSVLESRASEAGAVDSQRDCRAEEKAEEREGRLRLLRQCPDADNEFMARAERDLDSTAPPGGCGWSGEKPPKLAEQYDPAPNAVALFYEKYTAYRQLPHLVPFKTGLLLAIAGAMLPYRWMRYAALANSLWVTLGGPRLLCRWLIGHLKLDEHKGYLPNPPAARVVMPLAEQRATELAADAGKMSQRRALSFSSVKKWLRDLVWITSGQERLVTIERKGYHKSNNDYDVRGQDERNKTMSYVKTVLSHDRIYYHQTRKDVMLFSDVSLQHKLSRQPMTDPDKWRIVAHRQSQSDAPTNINSTLRAAVVNGTPDVALIRKLRYVDVVSETKAAIQGFCSEVHPVAATIYLAVAIGLGMYLCPRWLPAKMMLWWQRTFNRIMYDLLFKCLWAPNWSELARRCRTCTTRLLC